MPRAPRQPRLKPPRSSRRWQRPPPRPCGSQRRQQQRPVLPAPPPRRARPRRAAPAPGGAGWKLTWGWRNSNIWGLKRWTWPVQFCIKPSPLPSSTSRRRRLASALPWSQAAPSPSPEPRQLRRAASPHLSGNEQGGCPVSQQPGRLVGKEEILNTNKQKNNVKITREGSTMHLARAAKQIY